jgi:hypothetical protein
MTRKPSKRPWCRGRCDRCKRPVTIFLCKSRRPMTTYFCKHCRIRSFRYCIPKGMQFYQIVRNR